MSSPFDPNPMRPLATLNSRAVAPLLGVDAALVGQTGARLLSKTALVGLIAPHAAALGLEGADPVQYPRLLNDRLVSVETPLAARRLAERAAEEFGRRLGALVASMALCPTRLTDPLDAWEAAYLRRWREGVREVALGGGHATGMLGAGIARAAELALAGCGLEGWRVRAAEHPSELALIGAARSLPETGPLAAADTAPPAPAAGAQITAANSAVAGLGAVGLVADFGGTRAKSGIAIYDERDRLARLVALPPRDISALTAAGVDASADGAASGVAALAAAMVAVLRDGLAAAVELSSAGAVHPLILCSVGAYVEGGAPLDTSRGIYNRLNRLSPDLKGWFASQVSRACGREVSVAFGHDASLAARSQAGRKDCVVIMLGSHLGVGFAPPPEGLREMADGFSVG